MIKKAFIGTMICTVVLVCGTVIVLQKGTASAQAPLTPIEELGKLLFFDTSLSEPAGSYDVFAHLNYFLGS